MGSVYIVGGSNSLMNKGWTSHLNADGFGEAANVSVGAATSLMGIFRFLRDEVPEGATVVWEYALNESNHFRSGQSLESLLHHLDWFMEIARRKKIRVLPLLLWTRAEQISGKHNAYRTALDERLKRYGLSAIDAWQPLQELAQTTGTEPGDHFEGNMHYAPESPFQPVIAKLVRDQIGTAAVPAEVEHLAKEELALCAPEGKGAEFANSILTTEVHPLKHDLTVKASGKLLASFVIAAREAGTITIDGLGTYSLQRPDGGPPKMLLLKHLVHWQNASEIAVIEDQLPILVADQGNEPIVQNTFGWRGPSAPSKRADSYISALIQRRI